MQTLRTRRMQQKNGTDLENSVCETEKNACQPEAIGDFADSLGRLGLQRQEFDSVRLHNSWMRNYTQGGVLTQMRVSYER